MSDPVENLADGAASRDGQRLSRREAIQWVLAASASAPWLAAAQGPEKSNPAAAAAVSAQPYGRDPLLNKKYRPGDFWPLQVTAAQRATIVALADLILPADEVSPAASAVGVPDFIAEWISAPYPLQEQHRTIVIAGLQWIEAESDRRFGKGFGKLDVGAQSRIADDICYLPKASAEHQEAAAFFALFRDLVTSGFYTTPDGMRDIGFRGNTPMLKYSGPPKEILDRLGLG